MKGAIFTQDEYGAIVHALDDALDAIKTLGKSEDEAQAMLRDFVTNHYRAIWRKMAIDE